MITPEEITLLSKYIFNITGIKLDKDKGYLLETRLQQIMSVYGFKSFNDIYYRAISADSADLKKDIIDAITTNETFFFRDNTPFDLMRNKIIPDLIDTRTRQFGRAKIPLRIWSAACSTGQEAYSIAMTLLEMLHDLTPYDIFILGTDISDFAVARASYGKFNQFEMNRGLPKNFLHKYFYRDGQEYRIIDQVRFMTKFEKMNLFDSFNSLGKFDIIFCRNVAIYFSQPDKIILFRKIAKSLNPDGVLLVGGSEAIGNLQTGFKAQHYLKGIFYQLDSADEVKAEVRAIPPVIKDIDFSPTKRNNVALIKAKVSVAIPKKDIPQKKIEITEPKLVKSEVKTFKEQIPVRQISSAPIEDKSKKPVKTSLLSSLKTKHVPTNATLAFNKNSASKPSLLIKISKQAKKDQQPG